MVRLEKQGDKFVMITGQKQNISQPSIYDLITAISELEKNPVDKNKIQDGLVYLDNFTGLDLRDEIRAILKRAIENKGLTITDL
jgi:hypothetical protein